MADGDAPVGLDDGDTRRELDRYQQRSLIWLVGGLIAIVPAALLTAPLFDVDEEFSSGLAVVAMLASSGAILAVIIGAGGLSRAARMRQVLKSHPWQRWASRFVQEKTGSYERNMLLLSAEGQSPDQAVATAKLPSMLRATLGRSGLEVAREVDVAGDPTTGSAVVRAEGYKLLVPVRGRGGATTG